MKKFPRIYITDKKNKGEGMTEDAADKATLWDRARMNDARSIVAKTWEGYVVNCQVFAVSLVRQPLRAVIEGKC